MPLHDDSVKARSLAAAILMMTGGFFSAILDGMRITGGKYVNRRIQCPKGEIRPAMDRMRESLFSILGNLTGRSFLDLFSGSGLVAVEAASRGAGPLILVEKDYRKAAVIRKNLEIIDEKAELKLVPVEKFIKTSGRAFDIIFLDPPFSYPKKEKLLVHISEAGLLAASGILLLHHPSEDGVPEIAGDLLQYRLNRYGRSLLRFYRHSGTEPNGR